MNQRAPVTDSGAGSDSWHYGAYCTEKEARKLCKDLHLQFAVEIEKGVLRVERTFWSLDLAM
jgi:hypothetical protein